jgi:hypothetical protein
MRPVHVPSPRALSRPSFSHTLDQQSQQQRSHAMPGDRCDVDGACQKYQALRYKHGQMSWNGMFCDRTHSSMCQTSIDSNLGVLLRAGTDEKVPDKLVNTIRARKVPNNVTDVSFSNIEVNPRGFRILTRRISTSDIHGWHGYRAWTSLGRCAAYLQP